MGLVVRLDALRQGTQTPQFLTRGLFTVLTELPLKIPNNIFRFLKLTKKACLPGPDIYIYMHRVVTIKEIDTYNVM